MRYIIFPSKKGYRADNDAVPLSGDTLTVQIADGGTHGTLQVNGKSLYVHRGICAVPADVLCEGENKLMYRANDTTAFALESIFVHGTEVLCPEPLPRDAAAELLCLCAAQRKLCSDLEKRINKLEMMCTSPSLI